MLSCLQSKAKLLPKAVVCGVGQSLLFAIAAVRAASGEQQPSSAPSATSASGEQRDSSVVQGPASTGRTKTIRVDEPDPTEGRSVKGFSLDYWWITSKLDPRAPAGSNSSGSWPGIAGWIGSERLLLNLQYHRGEIDTQDSDSTTTKDTGQEVEATLRYIPQRFQGGVGAGGYFLGGAYLQRHDYHVTAPPGYFFTLNNARTLDYDRAFIGPMLGVGAIINLGNNWATRDDLKLAWGTLRYSASAGTSGENVWYYAGTISVARRLSYSAWLQFGLKLSLLARSLTSGDAIDKNVGLFVNTAFVVK